MSTNITSYKQLMAEKEHLTALLQVQTQKVQDDFRELKEELKPLTSVTSTLAMFFTRKSGSILSNLGINLVVNGLVKKVLLSKTGWITRFIVPLLLKNYASNLVKEPEKLISKIKNLFSKNGKADHEAGIEAV
jgi:hypothetical protein